MADASGEVVCVGIIERGQPVNWSPGGNEPDPVEWIAEADFADILRASAKSGLPVLPKLDIYSQSRLSPKECRRILVHWDGLETASRGALASAPAASLHRLIELCANGSQEMELLIEGP